MIPKWNELQEIFVQYKETSDMTFDQIQYFIAIAECNTYFDAAEELNISQSALSKQIIKLEKELGVALLDDDTAVHEEDAVRSVAGKLHLVRDDDHRRLVLGQLAQDAQHLAGQLGVKG